MPLRPNARFEIRRGQYKVAVDAEQGRRRREDTVVEIKNRREENLQKKRCEVAQLFSTHFQSTDGIDNKVHLENLRSMVASICTEDSSRQLEATTQLRRLLSIESGPTQEVIQAGVVPRLVEFLTRKDFPKLQFEAAWALTNIVSGTSYHSKVVADHGAIPIFVKLLASPSDDVREQAVWALGNVAGDSPKLRDLVLGHGALGPLLSQLNERAKLSMLRIVTWTLSNLCRGKTQPVFEQMKPALPFLQQLIQSSDEEVLANACWALSYLSDGTNDKILSVTDSGACSRLVGLLLHPSPSVVIPVLRTVGNIVTGEDINTQCVISHNALPYLRNLLTGTYKKRIKREACWAVANINAGNKEQIQSVIEAKLIGPLVQLLQNAEYDVKKEAAWAISNATFDGDHEQIKYLVSQQCIKPMCNLLDCPDPMIVIVCLEGLENILRVGEADKNLGDVNLYSQLIDEAKGLEKIKKLQNHDSDVIFVKAVMILEKYWPGEEEVGGFSFD